MSAFRLTLSGEETPHGPYLKSHRALLAPTMPEAKWLRACNPYAGWNLWRQPHRKPFEPETVEQTRRRQLTWKPAGYTWRLWWQRPDDRATYAAMLAERQAERPPRSRAA